MEILYKNNILEIEDLKVLGANNEGVVYQYKNNAIKIYHKHPKKFILTKDVCEQFTKIKTQQILMPNDLVYSKDKEYIGVVCFKRLIHHDMSKSLKTYKATKQKGDPHEQTENNRPV